MRGQVTVFIVIAAVLLIGGYVGYTLYESGTFTLRSSPEEYIATCINDLTQIAVHKIARHSGYAHPAGAPPYQDPGDGRPHKDHYFMDDMILSYVVDGSEVIMPTRESMQKVLTNMLNEKAPECYNLPEEVTQGAQLTLGDTFETQVTIKDDEVEVITSREVKLLQETEELQFSDVITRAQLRLGHVHRIATQLTQHAKSGSLNLNEYCRAYAQDGMTNIYTTDNPYAQDYAVRVVDATPTDQGDIPLTFAIAMKNVEVTGRCAN